MPERPLAVVTGASSGIGAAFARQLAARGYDLLLVARREDRLKALAAELRVPVEIIAADLSVEAECARLAERIRNAANLSLLVNNAGFGTLGLFWRSDLESQRQMHQLHILAMMTLTHAALTNLTARGVSNGAAPAPGIINVASIASFGQSPSNVSYCATKAWAASFTEGIALELGSVGSAIRVQALCPGFTYSEFHDVMKMNRSAIPKTFWLTAEFVVRESLAGFDRNKTFVIPDWRYRCLVAVMKLVPGAIKRPVSIAVARRRMGPTNPS